MDNNGKSGKNIPFREYDIIVVGAGHAGIEAALAGARCGLKTALFTIGLDGVLYFLGFKDSYLGELGDVK